MATKKAKPAPPARKLGRLPPYTEAEKPRLKLAAYLRPDRLGTPPVSVDWYSRVPEWPMYLNDQVGDCTVAEVGHQIEAASTYGQGTTVEVAEADILAAYRAISGYVPGDDATDAGARIQDVLGYWRRVGIAGHKALAFAQVDPTDHTTVRQALSLFGSLDLGINLPRSALAQFDAKQAWSVVPRDGGIVGGHSVSSHGYGIAPAPGVVIAAGPGYVYVVTWGALVQMTWDFWDAYVEEAWVVIMPEWLDENGHDPAGIDLYGLGADLADLTGDPNPFPSNAPPPDPAPTPPTPSRFGCVTVTGILAALAALAALALMARA